MTDQTGAEQQSASGSRTGDVDVADPSRPDTTTDVQSGGATDVASGGPDAGTDDGAAIRGGEDVNAPRGERDDTDQERDATGSGDDTDDERGQESTGGGSGLERRGRRRLGRGASEDGRGVRPRARPGAARRHGRRGVPAGGRLDRGRGRRPPGVGQRRQPRRGLHSRPVRLGLGSGRVELDRLAGRSVERHRRRRAAHLVAGRDPRRRVRRRLGRDDRRRGRPARASRQGVGGHQDLRHARPRQVRRGRAAPMVLSTPTRPNAPASGRSTDTAPTAQVGTGSESADAPDARSSAWCVGAIAVPSVRLPGIPRLRA